MVEYEKQKEHEGYNELDCCVEHKGDGDMEAVVARYCPITESLEESLKQMKLHREGKIQLKTWDEYKLERKIKRESKDKK